MTWPQWIEELKERYLADAGNVFLLIGPAQAKRWTLGGETLDAVQVLIRFLKRTREVVAVLRPAPLPSRLEFADITDRQKFENLVKAYDLLQGRALPLVETEPHQALGRIWRALSTTGTPQAYLITETERLLPGHRRRVDPIPGAPELLGWPSEPTLTRSNNLMVFLAADRSAIRSEFADQAVCIELKQAAPPPPPVRDIAPPALLDQGEPDQAGEDGAAEPEAFDLQAELREALVESLATMPAEYRAARLPVMAAVARVVRIVRPERWGELSFALDADGAPVVTGQGAETFLSAWRGDVALDAAAGMLVKSLPTSFSPEHGLDGTAVGALTRRVDRLLR
jgi:hypothetical protein